MKQFEEWLYENEAIAIDLLQSGLMLINLAIMVYLEGTVFLCCVYNLY